MTIKEKLIKPFTTKFVPPKLNLPLTTIKMPSPLFCMVLILASFFIITSGAVFCYVHKMPFYAYTMGPHGMPVMSWYDSSLGSQLFSEGLISSAVCILGALSLLTAFFLFSAGDNFQKNHHILYVYVQFFAASAPLWGLMYLMVFRVKIPQFFPTPFIG